MVQCWTAWQIFSQTIALMTNAGRVGGNVAGAALRVCMLLPCLLGKLLFMAASAAEVGSIGHCPTGCQRCRTTSTVQAVTESPGQKTSF